MSKQTAHVTPFDPVLEAGFWRRNRNLLLGIAGVVVIAVAAIQLVRARARSVEAAGWNAFVTRENEEPLDFAAIDGTRAEPWALWAEGNRLFDEAFAEHDTAGMAKAAELLKRLEQEHSDHLLVRQGRVEPVLRAIEREQAWLQAHPVSTANPAPAEAHRVTLRTDAGDIVVGLYPEQAPAAVKGFLNLLRDKKLTRFDQVSRGTYLMLSAPEKAADDAGEKSPESAEDGPKKAPESADESAASEDPLVTGKLSDRNRLSHFKGTLSFVKAMPYLTEPRTDPQVAFYLGDAPHRDDAEVVFGTVVSGLDVLEKIAEREYAEGQALALKEPVTIQSIEEAPALAEIR